MKILYNKEIILKIILVMKFLIPKKMRNFFLFLSLSFLLACSSNDSSIKKNQLFDSDSVMRINLDANFEIIFNDVDEKRFFHAGTLSYFNGKNRILIPISIKTRGYYRRDTTICSILPLTLKFEKKHIENTIFEHQKKLKLVLPCRNDTLANQFLLREYLVYKIYQLFSPYSYKVKLIDISLNDSTQNHKRLNAFFIESSKALAQRNEMKIREIPYLENDQVDDYMFGLVSIFQYMMGNHDWSVYYLHNINLLYDFDLNKPIIVPYDFDLSAFVDADYSKNENDFTSEILEREYMGEPRSKEEIKYILNFFIEKKAEIEKIIKTCPSLNKESEIHCLKFINQFYLSVENDSIITNVFQGF